MKIFENIHNWLLDYKSVKTDESVWYKKDDTEETTHGYVLISEKKEEPKKDSKPEEWWFANSANGDKKLKVCFESIEEESKKSSYRYHDTVVTYTERNNSISYSEYIASQVDNSIRYAEYLSGQLESRIGTMGRSVCSVNIYGNNNYYQGFAGTSGKSGTSGAAGQIHYDMVAAPGFKSAKLVSDVDPLGEEDWDNE
jgi:hypothetical protein